MQIFIPTPLRPYAEGKDALEVNVATIAEALEVLTQTHPGLRRHLFTEAGKLRAFVNLYLNEEDVRYLPEKESTPVSATDTLSIIPSIAGGGPNGSEAFFQPSFEILPDHAEAIEKKTEQNSGKQNVAMEEKNRLFPTELSTSRRPCHFRINGS